MRSRNNLIIKHHRNKFRGIFEKGKKKNFEIDVNFNSNLPTKYASKLKENSGGQRKRC